MSATMVHFEAYRLLKNEGYEVIAEYQLHGVRADLALFKDGCLVALVECKGPHSKPRPEGRQTKAYIRTGLPVFWCRGEGELPIMMDWVRNIVRLRYTAP